MNPPDAAPPLLFNWAPQQQRRPALLLFLGASLILHALCFYLFQIVYPPTVALPPAPARVSVISPDNSDYQALLRWLEAEDPALASTTRRPGDNPEPVLPKLEHVPSYAQHEPALKTLPETPPDLGIPSSAALDQLPRAPASLAVPLSPRKTVPAFSHEYAALGSPIIPEFTFHLSRSDAPANAQFRIAIDPKGAVRYCFLAASSGDQGLDDQAREFLLRCRFPSPQNGDTRLVWSVATMLWGNDFAPLPSPAPMP